MILRGFRAAGQFMTPGAEGTMLPSLGTVTWISSLVDWLREIDIGLHLPGRRCALYDAPISSVVGAGDLIRRVAASRVGVGCLSEIHMVSDLGPLIPGLEWASEFDPAPLSKVAIRVGQVWSFQNRPGLYEILGFTGLGQVIYILWQPGRRVGTPPKTLCRGDYVHIDEANFCRGAGGGRTMGLDAFIHLWGGASRLVFLSPESHGVTGVTSSFILGSRERCPCLGSARKTPELWLKLLEMVRDAEQIYTDGSKSSFKDVEDFYLGVETSSSSSGLALWRPDGVALQVFT